VSACGQALSRLVGITRSPAEEPPRRARRRRNQGRLPGLERSLVPRRPRYAATVSSCNVGTDGMIDRRPEGGMDLAGELQTKFRRAVEAFHAHDLVKAEGILQQIAKSARNIFEVEHLLGVVKLVQGRFAEAETQSQGGRGPERKQRRGPQQLWICAQIAESTSGSSGLFHAGIGGESAQSAFVSQQGYDPCRVREKLWGSDRAIRQGDILQSELCRCLRKQG
jgi:hypothetical protein